MNNTHQNESTQAEENKTQQQDTNDQSHSKTDRKSVV